MIELGSEVSDRLTGASGTAVARTEFLNGCVRYAVQPHKVDEKTGGAVDYFWVDEPQLTVIQGEAPPEAAPTGGPRPDAMRAQDCPSL